MPLTKFLAVSALFVLALPLSACSEYLDRRETLVLGTGNAVQTNIVMHQIDPWPRHAGIVPSQTSGERAQRAVERYRNPRAGSENSSSPASPTRSTDGQQRTLQ